MPFINNWMIITLGFWLVSTIGTVWYLQDMIDKLQRHLQEWQDNWQERLKSVPCANKDLLTRLFPGPLLDVVYALPCDSKIKIPDSSRMSLIPVDMWKSSDSWASRFWQIYQALCRSFSQQDVEELLHETATLLLCLYNHVPKWRLSQLTYQLSELLKSLKEYFENQQHTVKWYQPGDVATNDCRLLQKQQSSQDENYEYQIEQVFSFYLALPDRKPLLALCTGSKITSKSNGVPIWERCRLYVQSKITH